MPQAKQATKFYISQGLLLYALICPSLTTLHFPATRYAAVLTTNHTIIPANAASATRQKISPKVTIFYKSSNFLRFFTHCHTMTPIAVATIAIPPISMKNLVGGSFSALTNKNAIIPKSATISADSGILYKSIVFSTRTFLLIKLPALNFWVHCSKKWLKSVSFCEKKIKIYFALRFLQ